MSNSTSGVILTQADIRSGAVQVKNRQRDFILKQLESGKYDFIVANRDAIEGIEHREAKSLLVSASPHHSQ